MAVGIAIVVVAVGIVGIKAMLGDEVTELPYEEQTEKILDVQESPESGESPEEEAQEYGP